MILAAIRKDVTLLVRDRGALISLFALPVIFIVAIGSTITFGPGSSAPRTIAVWHADGDRRGEAVVTALESTRSMEVRREPTPDAVRAAVMRRASAGVVIPAGLLEPTELVLDGGAPLQARAPLQAELAGIVATTSIASTRWSPHVVVTNPADAGAPLPAVTSFQVAVPANAVLFGFFIALTLALALAAERRSGTWRRHKAAPVARWKLLVATLVPYYAVGIIQFAFLFSLGIALFDMKVAGSYVALVAVSLAVTYSAVGLGLLLAAFTTTEKQLGGIGSVALLVMGMLGGCMVPRLLMPKIMQTIGLATPHGWALDAYYDILVRQSTTLADVAPALGVLALFGTAFGAIGLLRFRWD